jgi:hypothetical protein
MPKDDAGGILKQQIKLPIWVDAKAENVTLSANSVTAHVRPLCSLAIWLVDEGVLASNPFRRSRRLAVEGTPAGRQPSWPPSKQGGSG